MRDSTIHIVFSNFMKNDSLSPDDVTPITRFTTKHVSPALQQIEFQQVSYGPWQHGSPRVYSGVSEVSVVYKPLSY